MVLFAYPDEDIVSEFLQMTYFSQTQFQWNQESLQKLVHPQGWSISGEMLKMLLLKALELAQYSPIHATQRKIESTTYFFTKIIFLHAKWRKMCTGSPLSVTFINYNYSYSRNNHYYWDLILFQTTVEQQRQETFFNVFRQRRQAANLS